MFEERGHHVVFDVPNSPRWRQTDVVLHMWADGVKVYPNAVNVVFMRRYELFEGKWMNFDWKHIDAMILCNDWIKTVVDQRFKEMGVETPTYLIYNAADLDRWTYKERNPGYRIGMACHVHPKKNLPLALQILGALDEEYELHIAGDIQDSCTAEYLLSLGVEMDRKIFLYGHVPAEELDGWWEDKNYCLSTSISEGNPNNVIEAMAKGIKPLVHSWPGAKEQFGEFTFETVEQAVELIEGVRFGNPSPYNYDSPAYRALVEKNYSLFNFRRVANLVEDIQAGKENGKGGH